MVEWWYTLCSGSTIADEVETLLILPMRSGCSKICGIVESLVLRSAALCLMPEFSGPWVLLWSWSGCGVMEPLCSATALVPRRETRGLKLVWGGPLTTQGSCGSGGGTAGVHRSCDITTWVDPSWVLTKRKGWRACENNMVLTGGVFGVIYRFTPIFLALGLKIKKKKKKKKC